MSFDPDTTYPVCCDGTGDCDSYGTCVRCKLSTASSAYDGDGSTQGTCPNSSLKCCSDGSCKSSCS